ncbi:MAG: hypothetical protein HY331_12660 [Chloroflexi bacterium]|nr:hypothetical protein [Chloroflexota bacterium]
MRTVLTLSQVALPARIALLLQRLLLVLMLLAVALLTRTGTAAETVTPTVATVAGVGRAGDRDGPAYGAFFQAPAALALDREGVLYIADGTRIRRLSPQGDISTLAGSAQTGFANGVGADARFGAEIGGLAVGPSGELYVADASNHAIRRVDRGGRVTTIAGSGASGYRDGPSPAAKFDQPYGLAISSQGDLYVGEVVGSRIRKIGGDGRVTTLAGTTRSGYQDGPGRAALFVTPSGLTIGGDGALYLTEGWGQQNLGGHRIRRVTRFGFVSTVAGGAGSGPSSAGYRDGHGTAALFSFPQAIVATRSGLLLVADEGNHCIRAVRPDGLATTVAGKCGVPGYADGAPLDARFNHPRGLALDARGDLYVADTLNYRIRKIHWYRPP